MSEERKGPYDADTSLGDMPTEEFRKYGHQVVDWIADYLASPERYPVLSRVSPGQITDALPKSPPAGGEDFKEVLADLDKVIVPGITHWNHPAFFAYFAISGSGPGILGEMLAAAFNVNAMLWRTSPAATELEEVALSWLRQMVGLPETFSGVVYDTASISSLCAIAAAREAVPGLRAREDGLGAHSDGSRRLRLYASEQAHSSIEKAAITLGIGQAGVRTIPTDGEFKMDPAALARAVKEDRDAGWLPFCVVATVGSTSTTSVDPVPTIADVCERDGIWLHVDAAYGGSAALLPEMKWILEGCDRADSLVMNPHKWLFVPVDLSVLFCRKMDVLRQAFSLVPEYLRTGEADEVRNYMDYGPQLGRRMRALKLWFVIRYFGVDGLAARIREHIRLAREFADWVDASRDFERLAPTPMSTVCFRARPFDLREDVLVKAGKGSDVEAYLDRLNERVMEEVNAGGEVFLSHTKLRGKLTLRIAIGNIRTTGHHVERAREKLESAAHRLDEEMRLADLRSRPSA
jgi:aromatic-L-amino-acid decarboxylase